MLFKKRYCMWVIIGILTISLFGCGKSASSPQQPLANQPTNTANSEDSDTATQTGTLQFFANGEDFIRQGFVTKDGWSLHFDHLYVTLADVTAYQTDPPYDAQAGGEMQANVTAKLEGTHTVDLAEGEEDADPILVGEIEAPAGRYNALSWQMVQGAETSPASGAVILMQGRAEKAGETISFSIALDNETTLTCGDYVGDERKGILSAGETATLEATFHFDHLFGDGSMPADDSINTDSLGFAPLAVLATDGILDVDMAMLKESLSSEAYTMLEHLHLAHVGEGHCGSLPST